MPGMTGMDATSRSRLYLALAGLFDYPDAEFRATVADGSLARGLRDLLDACCPQHAALAEPLRDDAPLPALQADYSYLFDVGNSGKPPCPLFGGTYGSADRMKVMEEALRFYHLFGLRLDAANHDMPDQLRTQLEFLHFLAHSQAESHAAGEDTTPFARAERDFLARHPAHWIPLMHARLRDTGNASLYADATALLDRVITTLSHNANEEVTS